MDGRLPLSALLEERRMSREWRGGLAGGTLDGLVSGRPDQLTPIHVAPVHLGSPVFIMMK